MTEFVDIRMFAKYSQWNSRNGVQIKFELHKYNRWRLDPLIAYFYVNLKSAEEDGNVKSRYLSNTEIVQHEQWLYF